MIDGAFVFPVVTLGMTDASATRRPSRPWTRSRGSTTAARIGAHLAGADLVVVRDRRLADVLAHGVCRVHRRARVALLRTPGAQGRGRADPPAQLDGGDQALEVGLEREDVGVERDGILGRGPRQS